MEKIWLALAPVHVAAAKANGKGLPRQIKKTRTKSSSAKSQRSKSRSKSSAKSGFRARPRSDSTVEQLPSTLSWRTPLFAFTTDQINHEKLKVAVREYKYVSPKKTFLERLYLNKFWDFCATVSEMVGSKHNYSCRLHMFWYTGHSFVCVWIHPRGWSVPKLVDIANLNMSVYLPACWRLGWTAS